VISYTAEPKSRLVVYRGTAPITGASDLLDATLVAAFTDKDGSFADYPVPGVDYYYAILGEEDLKAGQISLVANVNTLTQSVQVPAAALASGYSEPSPSARTPPLPYFLMENGAAGGDVELPQDDGPPPAKPVAPDTEKAITSILAKTPVLTASIPAVSLLPEELAAPSGGEDYALSLIVGDKIASKDWAGAADQLRKYLSLNRGPKAAARARFYLGESLAQAGSERDAFFEFLSARDFYPLETKPWIEFVLRALRAD
jgi:TolA-binding protein